MKNTIPSLAPAKLMLVSLVLCTPWALALKPADWNGEWVAENASLVIQKTTDSGFSFEMHASFGAHAGEITGDAIAVSASEARYKHPDSECEVRFTSKAKTIIVSTQSCESMGGSGVNFDATYKPAAEFTPPKHTLVEQKALRNAEQEAAFAKLTGPKSYERFVEFFQLISDGNDIDGLSTEVKEGVVMGLYGSCQAIIMSAADNKFYAAVINDEHVDYFTNDKAYCGKLPKTIAKWKEGFDSYPVQCKICSKVLGAAPGNAAPSVSSNSTPSAVSSGPQNSDSSDSMNFGGLSFSDSLEAMDAKLIGLKMFEDKPDAREDKWPLRYFAEGDFTDEDTIHCAALKVPVTEAVKSDAGHMVEAFTVFLDNQKRVFAYAVCVAPGKEVLTLKTLIEKYGKPKTEFSDTYITGVGAGVATLQRCRWLGKRNGMVFFEGYGSMSDTRVLYFDQEYMRPLIQAAEQRKKKTVDSTNRQRSLF